MKEVLIAVAVGSVLLLASFVLDWKINPWLARRSAKKVLNNVLSGKFKRRVFDTTIIWDSEKFFIRHNHHQTEEIKMSWQEVVVLTAYKRDQWSTDLICFHFAATDGMATEINEETNEFWQFAEALPDLLPGCKPLSSWVYDVSLPAFAPNVTEIYRRTSSEGAGGGAGC